jgi:hypothetical protein
MGTGLDRGSREEGLLMWALGEKKCIGVCLLGRERRRWEVGCVWVFGFRNFK